VSPFPAKEVTIICLRLKYQIDAVVPCELPEEVVTKSHSQIITPAVIETAKTAGGDKYKACVVFCLLVVKKWFQRLAIQELWDQELYTVRAIACEVIAKHIIEGEEDLEYLLQDILLKRYSLLVNDQETAPANVIERAVDLHALRIIGSSGYQKCISYLWKGWLIQDENDPSRFIEYRDKTNTSYWSHLDPDRMRVPLYQNALQIIISVVYLALYSGAINTINPSGDLDVVEGLLYIFTAGFLCDEISKFWKVGRYYFSFWNAFNSVLYALLVVSFVLRMIALGHPLGSHPRERFNELSYDFLAFSAPMFWARLLLYFDSFRFFGTMIVVVKVMMRESLIFFALLLVVLIGFLQAFIGLDQVDNNLSATSFVVKALLNAIMTSPEFDGFERFSPPFGLILYYLYTFTVLVILLNILIALYSSAYDDIVGNSADEFLALFAQKTMQFVRAPDENVFIAPFNLIEIFCLILPFEWWMSKDKYEKLNDYVMATIYSPLLVITAAVETRRAHAVKSNRMRGAEEDDVIDEWEQLLDECNFVEDGWEKKVNETKPDVEQTAIAECKELRKEVAELKDILERAMKSRGSEKGAKST